MSISKRPDDSLITYTIEQMNARLAERICDENQAGSADLTNLRSGLLFTGNVHDAVPRRLMLDTRLSPLDKVAWMMIRLYAQQNQQNQGAMFPTYDELQLQLASPFKGKASRETVSRVLLMLRLTGWLSLCRRVRDSKGRIRGNIYSQHDEPLSACDAESLDPTWLDTVAAACQHKNRAVSQTAWSVLSDIRNDPTMRHYHSQLNVMAQRLGAPQTPQEMAAQMTLREENAGSSVTEPSEKYPGSETELSQFKPNSVSELGETRGKKIQSSDSELSLKSTGYSKSAKPNCNVRSFTQSVNKKTYVPRLPEALQQRIPEADQQQIHAQLQALPEDVARQVLENLSAALARGEVSNPTGWLFSMMKRARNGALFATTTASKPVKTEPVRPQRPAETSRKTPGQVATREHVSALVAKLRQGMARARNGK
ncbi:helix-turn-helix domain-containing protein [Enterobacter cloacae complex sp. P29RS]|uniref:STY4528 family pathogenicity island replication protein n=1 Tax=Enterobacter cloacae complex sp. P29RS TaxID=2779563 RepID=UPI001869136C|nr:STY4528 family pathogenicity island replication protein [Enterobacter cloacae complex sp. P29RS]MBE3175447.1 helix-turn-helix domain-containing protein [Enterobacter cloacae complex sp. P29RS]